MSMYPCKYYPKEKERGLEEEPAIRLDRLTSFQLSAINSLEKEKKKVPTFQPDWNGMVNLFLLFQVGQMTANSRWELT